MRLSTTWKMEPARRTSAWTGPEASGHIEAHRSGSICTIEIRRDSDGSLIADPITLAAGASVSSITLKDVPEYGNAACAATITATRDGKTVGTLEIKTALHAAYLWPKEVMSK